MVQQSSKTLGVKKKKKKMKNTYFTWIIDFQGYFSIVIDQYEARKMLKKVILM